ncbi:MULTISPECIES: hypothetical protein [unclassified Nostoc]|nr:hypothetical protein [Nostoc sp. JL23]MBN3877103.1 hypothetical protein [Nostoc sp. JL23]
MDWFPTYAPKIINGFFHNLSHGCNPRSNIKNIRQAIAYRHGLERN